VYDIIKDVPLNYTEETSYWASTFPADIPASKNPSVIRCDTATSDVYYAGTLLSEAFGNYTSLLTRGEGVYCMTAQVSSAPSGPPPRPRMPRQPATS
jgi:purine nucleoside permease